MATGAVQGNHQLGAEPLAQLVGAGQRLDLRDHLHGVAVRQLGVDEPLVGDDAQLLQPLCLRPGPLLVGELGVRLTAPQRQGVAQRRRRSRGVTAPERRPGVGHEALEAGDVECLGLQLQHVAGSLRHDRRARSVPVDHPTDPRHVATQRGAGRRRRLTREHGLGEPVHRNHSVPMDQQDRHQPPLARPADTYVIAIGADGQRAQRVEPQHPPSRFRPPLDESTSATPQCSVAVAILWQPL